MRKHGMVLVLELVILAVLLIPGPLLSAPDESPSPERGQVIFSAYCASCHGDDGLGNGPMGGRLEREFGVRPANLANPALHEARTDAQLAQAIKEGVPRVHQPSYMPAWAAVMTDRQVGDLVAYVRTLRTAPPARVVPFAGAEAELEMGRGLYRIHCQTCHGGHGEGGGPLLKAIPNPKTPPDLSALAFYRDRTDQDLESWARTGLAHGGLPASSRWWHRTLEPDDLQAVVYYLRALPWLTR